MLAAAALAAQLALESDNGPGHPLGLKAHMTPEAIVLLKPALDALAPIGANVVERIDDDSEADIGRMEDLGVPGAGLYVDARKYFDYHHTAADTLDKVDPRELQEGAAAMATVAWAAANIPDVLPRAAKPVVNVGR